MSNLNIPVKFGIPTTIIADAIGFSASDAIMFDNIIGDKIYKPEVETDFWFGSFLVSIDINK